MEKPAVFISYSHDSDAHKKWVIQLAVDLIGRGINVILDEFDLALGQDIVAFMADGISVSERVLLICTDNYVTKAESGSGGVGYERLIITAEIVQKIDTIKFIPIIRDNPSRAMPKYLGSRRYADFSTDEDYASELEKLARSIFRIPSPSKPPLGENPYADSIPPRLVYPSGKTSSGKYILDEDWFETMKTLALSGLAKLELHGYMELRFALHDTMDKLPDELLNAVKKSEIHTFGWPIGVVFEGREPHRVKPTAEGIMAEISVTGEVLERKSYDLWALRSTGDFYLLQSLFEDQRVENAIFFDTRIIRVTEALMFCSRLYKNLNASEDAPLSVRVRHFGLKDRHLTAASPDRFLWDRGLFSHENEKSFTFLTSINDLDNNMSERVIQVLKPMFQLFDFTSFKKEVYEGIVNDFRNGKIR